MRMYTVCLLSLALLATGADAQNLYRWVDKNGKVHYSDQPPPKEIVRKTLNISIANASLPISTAACASTAEAVAGPGSRRASNPYVSRRAGSSAERAARH